MRNLKCRDNSVKLDRVQCIGIILSNYLVCIIVIRKLLNIEIGPWGLRSFSRLQTFARLNYAYIMSDVHMNIIRINISLAVN